MKKIFFRADANSQIGLGHFIRSLALANMLKTQAECVFALSTPSEYQWNELSDADIPLETLPDTPQHFDAFLQLLKGDETVVLDNYFFDTAYQKKIKNKGCLLVCIDDIADRHFVADAIINHAGGVIENMYSCEAYTKLYLGLDYALLRKEFLEAAANRELTTTRKNEILICLGGADPANDTLEILKRLEKNKEARPVYVIVGAANKNIESITDFAMSSNAKVKVVKDINATEMLTYMKRCSTAITSPSTTSFEYIAVGGMLYLYLTADNQQSIYNCFINKVAFDFVEYPIENFERIEATITNQKTILDGKSPDRLRKVFADLNVAKLIAT